jgi:hypothetical protein
VQRRQSVAARGLAIGGFGEREALLVVEPRNDGIELRIDARDSLEVRGHDLARRHVFHANQARELRRAEIAQV